MVMSSLMFDGLKSVDRVQSEKRLARCLSGTNRDVFFPVRKSCFVFKMKLIHFVGRRIPKKWLNIGDIYLYYPPKSGLWIGCGRLGKRVNFGIGVPGRLQKGWIKQYQGLWLSDFQSWFSTHLLHQIAKSKALILIAQTCFLSPSHLPDCSTSFLHLAWTDSSPPAFSISATACMTGLRAILDTRTITATHTASPPMIARSCR